MRTINEKWEMKVVYNVLRITNSSGDEKINKKSLKQWSISFILAYIIGLGIVFRTNTVSNFSKIVDNTNNIEIGIFGIIVGAFSIYQAILGEQMLTFMYNNYKDILKEINESWLGTIIIYLFAVIGNYLLQCLLVMIPDAFLLINNITLSNICAFVLVVFYFTITIRILIEIKNFVFNLYNLFIIYNKLRILDEDKKNEENNKGL